MYHFVRFIKHLYTFVVCVIVSFYYNITKYYTFPFFNVDPAKLFREVRPRLPGARGPITRNTLISNFLQIADGYDNHKNRASKPRLPSGMSWWFFSHDREIFPSSYGNA